MNGHDPWCLVLSGGGAKGVYHIGVWRALRELEVPVTAFVGNSIGAIVAGFLAGGKEAELEEIARALSVDTLLALPENPKNLPQLWSYFVNNGGLDTGPLRKLLEQHIDEDHIRATGVDLGVVTVNVSDLRPHEIFLDAMEPGSLVDYLMASSAFPGFAMPRIGGKAYVDGGLWDNLPYQMARSRGWKRIILVDISGIGWNRRPDLEGAVTVFLRNSLALGGAFDFDRGFLEQFGLLGYLDTLRAFGRLEGHYTFLKPDPEQERRFDERLISGKRSWDPTVLPPDRRHQRHRLAALLDGAAEALEVERIRAWSYGELAAELASRAAREDDTLAENARRYPLVRPLYAALRGGALGGTPYGTLRLIREISQGRTRAMLERMLYALHPELPAAELYFALSQGTW